VSNCSRFFNERARKCAYFIDREENKKIAVTAGYKTRSYSRDTRSARSFSFATIQEDTSLLILAKIVVVDDSRVSKIHALHSFQIS
jgi:hypothetical protein